MKSFEKPIPNITIAKKKPNLIASRVNSDASAQPPSVTDMYAIEIVSGPKTPLSFVLNGGVVMKNWVNDQLRRMRDGIHLTNKNKMDAGMQNQFIKPHEKKDFTNVRKSQEHKGTLEKYDVQVTEALRRINEIISKI